MTNYENGKIYKIEPQNGEEGDVYIGSTCENNLSKRMAEHKNHYKCWKEGKTNKVTSYELFDKYDVDNCVIVLIELFPCILKHELLTREAHYIKFFKCVNRLNNKDRVEKDKIERIKKNKELYKEKWGNPWLKI
jgi:hypothetical protein